MGIWWSLIERLKKHSIHHLIIPLAGGIFVEGLAALTVGKSNKITSAIGVLLLHVLSLILGVCISWFIVMIILINQETQRTVEEDALAILEAELDDATSYFGVSVIPLTEWFDPTITIYVTRLLSRKLEHDNFRHERTLLFFSDSEYEKSRDHYTDEYHYGKCLAHLHSDCGISLSFMQRKEIFAVFDQLEEKYKNKLGCHASWTNKSASFDRKPSRRRLKNQIANLDFALITKPDETSSVLRVSKRGDRVSIGKPLEGDDVEPYVKLVRAIKKTIYKSNRLRTDNNFLKKYGVTERDRQKPKREAAGMQTYTDYRKSLFERLVEKAKPQFNAKKCTRLVAIHDGSGDATVRMDFEALRSYPNGQTRERLPIIFTSTSGFFRAPRIIQAEGGRISWDWDDSNSGTDRRGFLSFDPPLDKDAVSFVMERETYNGFYFNKRDRLDASGTDEESVSVTAENLYDSYELKVLFPSRHFPKQIKIRAINEIKTRNYKEEERIQSCFRRFARDSTVTLTIKKPLLGYTYKIVWSLPEDDIEELGLSGNTARIVRETIKRLLSLYSEPNKAQTVRNHLDELKDQIFNTSDGINLVDDPALEVTLHAYSEERKGLVMVASNGVRDKGIIGVGRSTVGQAYRRRALVRWLFDSNSDDSDFWDYRGEHRGIVSIPLFYPLAGGGRTCVLSLATSSTTSGFLRIIKKLDEREIRHAFTQHVNAWYARYLASALGLPDLRKEFPTESNTSEESELHG